MISFRDLGFWRTPRLEFLMRNAYRFANGFLANSEAVREVVVDRDGLARDRIAVIPNGLDVTAWHFRESRVPPKVVFVGNLNRAVKRPDLFIEAAAILAPRFPDVTWLCIGDGKNRGALEARAARRGLDRRLQFVGRQADIRPFLETATIGVNCSDSEGLANAVLEYMLAGAAVVATEVGGNREIIESEATGLLVPAGNAQALADAIARLLEQPELVDRLRHRARTAVCDRFSWSRCVKRHEALYLTALGGNVQC
jgi:glycosyltransferase involved in cell wall biosynthesis